MTIYSVFPLQFGQIETYPLASRKSKVTIADFAKPPAANSSLKNFLDSLPTTRAPSPRCPGSGHGDAAGKFPASGKLNRKPPAASVLPAAYQHKIPVTVHLAIGTDIPHMHPAADGPALGAATHHDFRLFCSLVKEMHPGGVYLNWGSAVLLPEVFLKAVSVVRNLGVPLRPITTANFDFVH